MTRTNTPTWHAAAEAVLLPTGAIAAALLLFGVFVWFGGTSPVEAWVLLFRGAFGDAFSWQNTLQRAAPLMLTALAVALPARAGLTVIGGEGALVLGALGCAGLPYVMSLTPDVSGSAWVRAMIRGYLAQADDAALAHACPMTLLLADVARDDDARKRRFAEVTRAMLDRVVQHFPARDGLAPRETALATYAALVGAVSLARTTPSRASRQAILRACETMLVSWLALDGDQASRESAVSPRSRVSRPRAGSRRAR